jgi:chromate transporter
LKEGSTEPEGGVAFGEARRAWLRVAAQSFGGPAGQIAVIHRICVEEKGWLDEATFLRALGYCMLLPGAEAQQLATYIGWKLLGVGGGLLAGGLFILPGFISILALSIAYVELRDAAAIEAFFFGLKPAVIAIVLQAVARLRRRALAGATSVAIAAGAFLAMFVFAVPFPVVIAAAGLIGAAALRPQSRTEPVARVRDDGRHRHRNARALRAAGVWLAIWLVPVAALVTLLTPDHVLAREAVFFSKTAVVTFGGAYAVLSYVAQQAVEVYQWLSPAEMLDGLGLAETTPGPLIQVVQFVGFIGAYRNAGDAHPLAMGIAGSVVTALVTFAPCFLFIFAGAPLLERLYERPGLQAALRGITAAVVGVILNLAVWFALHTLFAEVRVLVAGPVRSTVPVWATIDIGGAAIATVAILLAFRFGAGMFVVLGFGAAAGIAMRLLV